MIYRNIINSGKDFLANTGKAMTIAAVVACASLGGGCQSSGRYKTENEVRVPSDPTKRAEYIHAIEDLNARRFEMPPSEFVNSYRQIQNQYISGQPLIVPQKPKPIQIPTVESYVMQNTTAPKAAEEPKTGEVSRWNWVDPTFALTRIIVDDVLGAPVNWVRGKGFTRAHNSDAYANQDWKYRGPEAAAGVYGLIHYGVKNNEIGENTPLAEILNIRDGIKHNVVATPAPAPKPPQGLNGGSASTGFGGGQVSGDD